MQKNMLKHKYTYDKKFKAEKFGLHVKDHCSCTGKCGSAAHVIYNLKYNLNQDIFANFHDRMNCDYSFIIKKLVNDFNTIQNGLFRAAPGCSPLPKICRTYPTMMKLGAVIPYLNKSRKLYEPHDTPLGFCLHQHLFTGNQQILLYQEMQI